MNKLKDLADKGKNLADKQIKKLTEKDKKANFKIEVVLKKLTIKKGDSLPDLMYRLEWKRGPETASSRLIDIKAGTDFPAADITESFSRVSGFHTK